MQLTTRIAGHSLVAVWTAPQTHRGPTGKKGIVEERSIIHPTHLIESTVHFFRIYFAIYVWEIKSITQFHFLRFTRDITIWWVACSVVRHFKYIPTKSCYSSTFNASIRTTITYAPYTFCTSTDLQCVLNGIREVFEGTDGDGLLGRVLAGAVWLCEEGNHNLDVAFGSQSTRLQ